MIDTNVKGLLYVTRVVSGWMIRRGKGGHIVNLGSIAGTQAYENGAVYCASKHAVHALSQGMRMDFLSHGIKVTEIRPGMVDTEFSTVRFHGDKKRAAEVYRGVEPADRRRHCRDRRMGRFAAAARQYQRHRGNAVAAGQCLYDFPETGIRNNVIKREQKRFILKNRS